MTTTKRYEISEGSSHKFWEISREGCDVTTRWGRIGSDGQSKTKTLPDEQTAQREQARLVAAKTKKGYEEVAVAGRKQAAAKKTAAKKTAAKKTTAKKTTAKKTAAKKTATPAVAPVSKEAEARPATAAELKLTKVLPFSKDLARVRHITRIVSGDGLVIASGGTYYKNLLFTSADGDRFVEATLPKRKGYASGLRGAMVDSDGRAWVVGEYGRVLVSRDRGRTWRDVKVDSGACFWDIAEDKDGDFWIAGSSATIFRSSDRGKSWQQLEVALAPRDDRADPTCAPIGAGMFFCTLSAIWNGSKLSRPKGINARSNKLTGVGVSPAGTVVVVGDKGVALRSVDGGKCFTAVDSGVSSHLEDVAWVAGGFIAVGLGGVILRSIDDGQTFQPVAFKGDIDFYSVGRYGAGGFIGGAGRTLLAVAPTRRG